MVGLSFEERYKQLKEDLEYTKHAEVMGVNDITRLMLADSVEWNKVAQGYVLRQLKIPASYFREALPGHKVEVLTHAKSMMPNLEVNILKSGTKILAAGPVGKAVQSDFAERFNLKEAKVISTYGSLFEGQATVYLAKQMSGKFSSGVAVTISPLFGRGLSVLPAMFELRCTNGLIDVQEMGGQLVFNENDCLTEPVETAFSLSWEVSQKREKEYQGIINSYISKPAMLSKEVYEKFTDLNFPKSFVEKVTGLTESVQRGETNVELPEKVETMQDNWSVATYIAKGFAPASRSRLEERIMTTMRRLQ